MPVQKVKAAMRSRGGEELLTVQIAPRGSRATHHHARIRYFWPVEQKPWQLGFGPIRTCTLKPEEERTEIKNALLILEFTESHGPRSYGRPRSEVFPVGKTHRDMV